MCRIEGLFYRNPRQGTGRYNYSRRGEIVSGVSRKTTNLIVADLSSNSSKMQKAKELGIAIDTIELFRSKHLL